MKGVIAFREVLNFRFGAGDIYFVCVLDALSEDIKI